VLLSESRDRLAVVIVCGVSFPWFHRNGKFLQFTKKRQAYQSRLEARLSVFERNLSGSIVVRLFHSHEIKARK